jgi:hypothetical protein
MTEIKMEDKMKKLLSVLCVVLFLGVYAFPAINAGNLTTVNASTGWYSFAYDGGQAVVLMVDYTKGTETQLNIAIAYSFKPWTAKIVMLSERAADNVYDDVLLVLDRTRVRFVYIPTLQAKGTIYFCVFPTGSFSGTVLLNAEQKN